MTSPAAVAAVVNAQPDAKTLARLLVLQKAILDTLKEADAETRDQAKALLEAGDATAVHGVDGQLGRVRRDKPRTSWRVVDWGDFESWIRFNFPEAWTPSVAKWALDEIRQNGALVRKSTGEVLAPAGIGLVESDGPLVVTTTDVAEEWARQVVGRSIRGELE